MENAGDYQAMLGNLCEQWKKEVKHAQNPYSKKPLQPMKVTLEDQCPKESKTAKVRFLLWGMHNI